MIYLDEFLYRGRAPGDDRAPAWHVVLGSVGTDAFGRPFRDTTAPLTPDAALALGYDLPAILAAINTETLRECETLRAKAAEDEQRIAALDTAVKDATALYEQALKERAAARKDLTNAQPD